MRKLRESHLLLAGLAAFALTAHPHPAVEGRVLFSEAFDATEFAGWQLQSLPGRARTVSSTPFGGTGAGRFEVRTGDVEPDTGSQRSEVSGPTFHEGQDLYIRDAIRIPPGNTYRAPWQIIQQLHEHAWSGSPGIAVFLENDRTLKLGAGDSSPIYWQSSPLRVNRWYDLVYRVHLSRNPRLGFVEVWLNGVKRTLRNGRWRAYGQTIQAARTYIKAGIYRARSSRGTSIVEHDTIVVGTSLAAVTSE
jgi:Polysaccharide lyase